MRDKARVLVVASMICCIAGSFSVNLYLLWASQPHYPVYSCPAPPPGKTWIKVERGETPVANPLKGFMPYAGTGHVFPHSLEYSYFSLRSIAGATTGVFNFSTIDTFLDNVAGRGHQAVFRIYLDYPSLQTGVPQYLIDVGVEMRTYTEEGGGLSPDYDDPRVVAEMVACIDALSAAYDGDPRVGFIEAGMLGKWGEWHVSPHDVWMANETTQRAVLQAYEDAFTTTWILARYPTAITGDYRVGYHDDSFAYATLFAEGSQGWYFWVQMAAMDMSEVWQQAPIGGEVRPEIQAAVFRSPRVEGQDYNACVYTTHASWMLMSAVFHPTDSWWNMSDADLERAMEGSRLMGYDLRACWVNYTYSAALSELSVSVVVANFGVAPFYYNWTAEFGLFNQTGALVRQYPTPASILGILPGQYVIWNAILDGILPGDAGGFIGVRVPNVLPGGSPVIFSNKEISPDGWTFLCNFTHP
nr:hypothetical protein [Candidatus Sigynarchaeota archaeon]